jgi:lysophospholipase L1-like esterase
VRSTEIVFELPEAADVSIAVFDLMGRKIEELVSGRMNVQSEDLVYLDYFTATADDRSCLPAELSDDGVHPSEAGYRVMAPLAEAAIQRALRSR